MATAEDLWERCVGVLREEFPESVWKTWFESLRPASLEGTRLVLTVASPVVKERIESRYLSLITAVVKDVTGETHEVVLEVSTERAQAWELGTGELGRMAGDEAELGAEEGRERRPATAPSGRDFPGSPLNADHTFENFVVGESNRFAHAAALAVAEKPGKSWNPLFVYGGTGLGKTHLLHAIGHYVHDAYPNLQVRYVSTETFLNDFIEAIRTGDMPRFKAAYRSCHFLLVDDVQLIEGKERFQEEFFHTFEHLHGAGRQIVISSDRPPNAIATLEDRLRSRFSMGLITDVHPPALETRLAILRMKAASEQSPVPPEVLECIATMVTDNIRQLEGALNRVLAYASLNRQTISVAMVEGVLADYASRNERHVTPEVILEETSDMYGFSVDDLVGKSRSRPLVTARQVAMYVMRQMTTFSFPAIGRQFGGRDHTTVMHAVSKIEGQMREKRAIYDQVHELTNRIRAHSQGRSFRRDITRRRIRD